MSASTAARVEWQVPALLMLLGVVPAVAGTHRLAELAGDPVISEANARFATVPWPIVIHVLAVVPYSLLGAWQFSSSLRRRAWHRIAGRVLAAAGLAGALSGLWMAHFYSWPAGDGEGVYILRLLFGAAMAAALLLGAWSAMRRDFSAHEAWMTRAYAIGVAAGTQALTHLPWFILLGAPGEAARTFLMGDGWVINALIAEYAIARRSQNSRRMMRPFSPAPQPIRDPFANEKV